MDFDSNGNYVGGTTENLISFGVSMGSNFVGGGVAGSTARSAFKASGSEVMQIASRNAVVDSRGLYASTITRKYVVSPGSVETAEKYVVEQQFGTTSAIQIKRLLVDNFGKDLIINVWDNYISDKLNNY